MRLLYLVHDLGDAAVGRRLRFLRDGGGQVVLIGFRRHREGGQATSDGLCIGRTRNGRMLRRILSTVRAVILSRGWHDAVLQADTLIARSLEMLLLAVAVRYRTGAAVPIVYECLDIHRLMTRPDLVGRLLRRIERRLLDVSSLLIVSSPSFIDSYFSRVHDHIPSWRLLENKLLASELPEETGAIPPSPLPAGPPWRIGWFGIIRCKRSLELLAALVRASDGRVEVHIRGRVAHDVIPDFDAQIAATPGLIFGGPYDRTIDLAAIYGQVHFNWTIDFYEDGLNSAWLLPNRLYEGSIFNTVPIALYGVETGRWLASHGCGLLLDRPVERTLPALFAGMTPATFQAAQDRMTALDRAALIETTTTAASFVATLGRLDVGGVTPPTPHRGQGSMTTSLPFFSIAVPALNEENYIEGALSSLLDQVGDHDAEILVLDGGSHDRTRDIVSRIAAAHPVIRLIANPGRTQSAACNLAAGLADSRSRILIRADAHAAYPEGFLSHAIRALLETGATSVVVPMRTTGIAPLQRAIAATQNSRLGNGGSGHRRMGASRFVDHGHHAAFDIAFFRSLGGYDPNFTHNEDGELDVRALKAGGRIWLCSEAAIDYFPRATFLQLARQYIRHGRGRARTTGKHGLRLKLRQCLPLAILASMAPCLLTPVLPWAGVPATFYLLICLSWGVPAAVTRRDLALLLMGPAAIVMHLSWAIGFLDGRLRTGLHKSFLNRPAVERTSSTGVN